MYYWTCPLCGSNLDRNERCDCESEKAREQEKRREFFNRYLRMEPRAGQMSLVFEERKV